MPDKRTGSCVGHPEASGPGNPSHSTEVPAQFSQFLEGGSCRPAGAIWAHLGLGSTSGKQDISRSLSYLTSQTGPQLAPGQDELVISSWCFPEREGTGFAAHFPAARIPIRSVSRSLLSCVQLRGKGAARWSGGAPPNYTLASEETVGSSQQRPEVALCSVWKLPSLPSTQNILCEPLLFFRSPTLRGSLPY